MAYDINGYLGTQVEQIKKDNYKKHENLFKKCEELNRLAQEIKYKFNIKNDDMQGVVAAVIYIKIANAFQGAVLMFQYGLDSEAKILVRSSLEASFVLKALVKDKKNLELLEKDFNMKTQKHYERVIKDKDNVFGEIKARIDNNEYEKIKKKNKKEKARVVRIDEWARLSGSIQDYHYAYNILSADVHVDLGNLNKYVVLGQGDMIEHFVSIPSTEDIDRTLFTGMVIMLSAIDHMNQLTNIGIEAEIKKFEEIISGIMDTIV